MTLDNWLRSSWLVEHKADSEDIRALLAVADRELADSRVPGLSTDGRFHHAYNAALQAAAAALAAAGYRAARGSHHHVIIQSLAKTLGADAGTVMKFDRFRKKRNAAEYEMVGGVTELEATERLALAARLRKDVEGWIRLRPRTCCRRLMAFSGGTRDDLPEHVQLPEKRVSPGEEPR